MSNPRCLRVSIPHPLRSVYTEVSICRSHEEKEEDEDEPHFKLARVIRSSKGRGHGECAEIPGPAYHSAYHYHCRSRQRVVLAC